MKRISYTQFISDPTVKFISGTMFGVISGNSNRKINPEMIIVNPTIIGITFLVLSPALVSITDSIPLTPTPKGMRNIIVPRENTNTINVPYRTLPIDAAQSSIAISTGHSGNPLRRPNSTTLFLLDGLIFLKTFT